MSFINLGTLFFILDNRLKQKMPLCYVIEEDLFFIEEWATW